MLDSPVMTTEGQSREKLLDAESHPNLKSSLEEKVHAYRKTADRKRASYKPILHLITLPHYSKINLFKELITLPYILLKHGFQLKSFITFFSCP